MHDSPPAETAHHADPRHDPYAVIRSPNFRRYWSGNFLSILGMQMQSITVGWEIYARTENVFNIALVGLVQVIPVLSLMLLAGHVADRVDRRLVLIGAITLSGVASLGLAAVSLLELRTELMYVCLFLVGVARAFQQPAKSSLVPQLVPRELFANAVTWNLGGFQLASVAGPAVGGLILGVSSYATVYLLQVVGACLFLLLLVFGVRQISQAPPQQAATLKSLGEGFRFVAHHRVLLAAMALDMFAVLLGGATAMFPVYAKDILHVGSLQLGWMAAAPAVGALMMSLALVHLPPIARAGHTLLISVAGFGAAIIVFGLSTWLPLSLVALFLTGAFDCVSVVVRHTLVQTLTPDRMRGRVSAISGMFISASNELGEFESGMFAYLTSPVVAVVAGGIGTLAVVATTALVVPPLRRYGRLDGQDQKPAPPPAHAEPPGTESPADAGEPSGADTGKR